MFNDTPKYLLKARETYNFHRGKLIEDASWRVVDTARALKRSVGSISEDLKIAKAAREFPKLEKIKTAYEALKLIREHEKQTDIDEI